MFWKSIINQMQILCVYLQFANLISGQSDQPAYKKAKTGRPTISATNGTHTNGTH